MLFRSNDTATTEIYTVRYTLSLHDALPISAGYDLVAALLGSGGRLAVVTAAWFRLRPAGAPPSPHEAQGRVEPGPLGEALRAAFDPGSVLVGAA